jgi:hypothetical protein|nr:MAG TPA: hypothetical protein [Caudoviricetes sp.]
MERITERKTLSFNKGMTNVPSDLLSDDSELLESDGFIFKDGEMKPIQKPVKIKALYNGEDIGLNDATIMYVHKMADYKCIITKLEHTDSIICYKMNGDQIDINSGQSFSIGAPSDIKSVGNTLVCATEKGIHYLLYKGGKYVDLGTELPKPKVEFYTDGTVDNWQKDQDDLKKDSFMCNIKSFVDENNRYAYYEPFIGGNAEAYELHSTGLGADPDYYLAELYIAHTVKQDKETDFKNAVVGHVEQMINWVKDKNKFAFPFFVRFALKMFDGSYTRISNPIICYPSIIRNCKFVQMYKGNKSYYKEEDGVNGSGMYMYHIAYSGLFFKASIENKENWSDIIKEIVVFATDDVKSFELNGDWKFKDPMDVNKTVFYNGGGTYHENVLDFRHYNYRGDGYHPLASEWIMPVFKTEDKIIKELLNKTQFYKLFSLDMNSKYLDGEWHDSSAKNESASDVNIIEDDVVSNLTEQEQLKVDDYYGWTKLVADKLFVYNSRINTIGLKRYPFKGFNFFTENKTPGGYSYEYFVHIVTTDIDTWVKSDKNDNVDPIVFTGWLYYPDPNAKEMLIRRVDGTGTFGWRVSLSQHKMLNGAYSFANLPHSSKNISISSINVPDVTGGYEDLNSQIFTSVVNNPFVFEASGDNTVGTGKILGIIANTEAVSQGQFGQYPLMVFTDEGIYGMSVNSEGLYSASYPISREVSNENSPLVPTDRLVFFTSKKGLMAASGGSVACMSEQLKGRTSNGANITSEGRFLDFIKDCMIAYDYRDSLLRIYNKSKSYQYIYNMVDKTFSVVSNDVFVKAVVNDYPDNLIQDTEGNVYTLTGKPDVFDDDRLYSGEIITRPLKLGGSMILKSIRDIKHLCDTINGTLQLEIFGSNDCREWTQLTSTGGKPYKYYTFKYIFNNFLAGDSFAGSVVEIQRRREDKMR